MKVFKTATLKVRNADGEFESFPALRGETSYDIAVANGYEGTQEEWLNMMTDENGWVTRYYELDQAKANKSDVYTAAQIDELLRPLMKDVEENFDTGSYHAFVAGVNEDTISAAFGKNNEDLIKNVGRQMAMYAWFKGEDKATHSFDHLWQMSTLNNMNNDVYGEIIESDVLMELIRANEYARDKVFELVSLSDIATGNTANSPNEGPTTTSVTVSDSDLSAPFILYVTIPDDTRAIVKINEVNVLDESNSDDSSGTVVNIYEWSQFGITEPGTYDISLESKNSYYARECYCSLYKAKPSYDVTEE